MCIPLGGSELTMPEHFANEIQAIAARDGDRGESYGEGREFVDPDSHLDRDASIAVRLSVAPACYVLAKTYHV
jgi:hypothetical protein